MAVVERSPGGSSLIDVLDRVLDKGIIIDAWVRVSLVGIDLITVEARVVVASIDTYLRYADALGLMTQPARAAARRPAPRARLREGRRAPVRRRAGRSARVVRARRRRRRRAVARLPAE